MKLSTLLRTEGRARGGLTRNLGQCKECKKTSRKLKGVSKKMFSFFVLHYPGWHKVREPGSLIAKDLNDSEDPKHTLFCRETAFVAIYALFRGNINIYVTVILENQLF